MKPGDQFSKRKLKMIFCVEQDCKPILHARDVCKIFISRAHPAKMDFRKKLDPKHWSVQTMIFEA